MRVRIKGATGTGIDGSLHHHDAACWLHKNSLAMYALHFVQG